MNNPEFPELTPFQAAQVAASLAAASCSIRDRSGYQPEQTAQRFFLAHYKFLLERKWPDSAGKMSEKMNLD